MLNIFRGMMNFALNSFDSADEKDASVPLDFVFCKFSRLAIHSLHSYVFFQKSLSQICDG